MARQSLKSVVMNINIDGLMLLLEVEKIVECSLYWGILVIL